MKSLPKAQEGDPQVLCQSLILQHICRKPVSACPPACHPPADLLQGRKVWDNNLLVSFSALRVMVSSFICYFSATIYTFMSFKWGMIRSWCVFWEMKFSEHMYYESLLVFFMEQQCYLTLAEILPTSRISLFDKHVNYCWLLLYNYRIQMLFIGLSAVSHSNPNV